LAESEISRYPEIPRHQRISPVRVPSCFSHAIRHRVCVAVSIEAHKHGEGTAGLRRDDAAEFKVAKECLTWSIGREIGNKPVADILVRVGALERPIVEVLRSAYKGCERTVIQGLRIRIVGIEAKVLPKVLRGLNHPTVVDTVSAVVGVIKQSGIGIERSTKTGFRGRPVWRRRACSSAACSSVSFTCLRTDVQVFRPD